MGVVNLLLALIVSSHAIAGDLCDRMFSKVFLPARVEAQAPAVMETEPSAVEGSSAVAMVVVGALEDGTPILQRVEVRSIDAHLPQTLPRAQSNIRRHGHDMTAQNEQDSEVDNIKALIEDIGSPNPSPETLNQLMLMSIQKGRGLPAELLGRMLRRPTHPFALVFLANVALAQGQLDLLTDRQWGVIAKTLDNSDHDEFPDFALLYSKVATDLLLHSDVQDPEIRTQVIRELRRSAKYEDDIHVAFRAGVGFLLYGDRDEKVERRLRAHLEDTKIPESLRALARRLLQGENNDTRLLAQSVRQLPHFDPRLEQVRHRGLPAPKQREDED